MTTTATEVRPRSKGLPIYPILLGGILLFQLVATSGVGVWVSFRPLVVALLIGVVVTASLRILLGDADRSGPAAAFAMLAIMEGGDRRILALALLVIAIFLVERHVLRRRLVLPWPTINAVGRALSFIVAIAILIQAVQVGAVHTLGRSITAEGPLKPVRSFATATSSATPDIYVFLLDGYARSDALEQVFGVDDGAFLDGLRARGLTVSTHARTNYPITVQVVISMFHMKLLTDIPELRPLLDGAYRQTEIGLTHAVVQENPLFDYLHSKDYEIAGIASGFAQLSLREADDFITSGNINEFEIAILRRTILGDLVNVAAPDFISSQYRDRIDATWATLGRLAAERPGHPRFVFAHVPSPHPPWVFNADGSPRTSPDIHTIYEDSPDTTGLTDAQLKAGYGGSVQALWQPVLRTIDEIDRASAVPPVIVVFGDHGSWVGALPGDVRLRFLPILAGRVPGQRDPLPDDESLVNVFPDLLNPLFGATFPRVDPAPSFMFSARGEYDLHQLDDPNGAISAP
jgi:hypothetical protein